MLYDTLCVDMESGEKVVCRRKKNHICSYNVHLIPPNSLYASETYVVALADPRDIVEPSIVRPSVNYPKFDSTRTQQVVRSQ